MNSLEKALILRAARHLEERAATVALSHQPWTSAPESREKKKEHDRVLRDARDLRAYVAAKTPLDGTTPPAP